MDILEVIKTRRSIRQYTQDPISQEDVNKILEAGRWAPSASNTQPWKSVIAIGHPAETPQKARKELSELTFTDEYGKR
jgi:predicted oxidoreductase (fatty acid repression mutant protein)